jgi:hypothetical protein
VCLILSIESVRTFRPAANALLELAALGEVGRKVEVYLIEKAGGEIQARDITDKTECLTVGDRAKRLFAELRIFNRDRLAQQIDRFLVPAVKRPAARRINIEHFHAIACFNKLASVC